MLLPQRYSANHWLKGVDMSDHVYKIIELVGSSKTSVEEAIQNAVTKAATTIRDIRWFEVVETRGYVENGTVAYYQVTLKLGFTIEG
jgi:flavin-binding protein dodecin